MSEFVAGKSICVTGAGGSVGSELARTLLRMGASRLLLVDNCELALYTILEEIGCSAVRGHLGDVRDGQRMWDLLAEHRPQIVFNAAALKHVPMCERDSDEATKTNVFGLVNIALAAEAAGSPLVVQVSTDKAVEPVSALGRSKQMAEVFGRGFNRKRGFTRVVSVRFHNILDSSGSVLPKFRRQIAAGGPVTVTHPDMVRWFVSAGRACELLMHCAEHAVGPEGRDVYVLDAGKPGRIEDMAKQLIGDRRVEIVYIGMRPGERLEEKLIGKDENAIDVDVEGIRGIEFAQAVRPAEGG